MKAAIEKIIVTDRIRKDITRISELAEDIKKNGLLHPITVMALDDGGFRLLAGLRRIKAAQSVGWPDIDVNVVSPADAEAALSIEISENEQREPFTYSEKMDYAKLIEEIEKAKAKERMFAGKSASDPMDNCPEGRETRDIVGAKIGMSGRQYDRAKYVADNAPPEIIDQLDKGERTIGGTFNELREKEKSASPSAADAPPKKKPELMATRLLLPSSTVSEEETMKYLSKKDIEAIHKIREYEALPPEGKIVELQRQIKELRVRAVTAESDLENLKERYEISVDHKDSIIESLKRQNAELIDALAAADARIAELESKE